MEDEFGIESTDFSNWEPGAIDVPPPIPTAEIPDFTQFDFGGIESTDFSHLEPQNIEMPKAPAADPFMLEFTGSGFTMAGRSFTQGDNGVAFLQLTPEEARQYEASLGPLEEGANHYALDIGSDSRLTRAGAALQYNADGTPGKSSSTAAYNPASRVIAVKTSALGAFGAKQLGDYNTKTAEYAEARDGSQLTFRNTDAGLKEYIQKAQALARDVKGVPNLKDPGDFGFTTVPKGQGNVFMAGDNVSILNSRAMLAEPEKGFMSGMGDFLKSPGAGIVAALMTQAGAYLIAEKGHQAAKKMERDRLSAQMDIINMSAAAKGGGGGGGSSGGGRGQSVYGGR